MIDEKVFAHAVTLASAFVRNGDFRLQGKISDGAHPFDVMEDLIPVLYSILQKSRKSIEYSSEK